MSDIKSLRNRIKDARIYVIPYSHSDWAWTCTRQWHEERYTAVYEDVLAIMRDDPDYKWYFDTESEQLAPFRLRRPHLMGELRQRVKEGRIGICGGTITNPHPHRVSGEILIRSSVMGRRYFESEFPGVDLSVLTLNDVIYGHSQLPQIATKCGHKYYRSTRPQCLGERGIPLQFVWESPDGSRILCSRGQYGSTLATKDYMQGTWDDEAAAFIEADILPRLEASPTGAIWLARGADDIRPLRTHQEKPLDILGLVERWNENESARMQFATPLDYFRDVEQHLDKVPIVKGPVDPVGWSYWYGQIGNESLRTWRLKAEEQLLTAEKLAAVCSLRLDDAYPQDHIERLWLDLLSTCPHATLWLFTQDYDDMLWKLKSTCAAAKSLADAKARRLMSVASTAGGRGGCGFVLNPESRERTELVKLHKVCPKRGCRQLQFRDARGRELPYQLLDTRPYEDGTLKEADVLVQASAPSLGYTAVYVEESGEGEPVAPMQPMPLATLETDLLRLKVEDGAVVSLLDKDTGVDHLCPAAEALSGLVFHVIEDTGPYHFGPIIDTLHFECESAALVGTGPLFARGEVRGHIGDHQVVQHITVHTISKRVDFDVTIESAGGDGFFRAYFPFAYPGKIMVDIPFGVEPRDVAKEPYGSLERKRENVFWGSNWADYCTPEHGCALLIEPGMQGFCHFPDENLLGHTLLKTIVHPKGDWERFETRLREGKGTQRFRYALLPHAGDWAAADVDRQSVEFRSPLRWYWKLAPTASPTLADRESFLACSAHNVALSSLYREGDTVILRLFETRGKAADDVAITLPFAPSAAAKTDCLLRRLDDSVTIDGNVMRCSLSPWEIATVAIEAPKLGA